MKSFRINILFVGAGNACTMLLKFFSMDPSVNIIGVVDKNANASGMLLAQELGIPNSSKFQKFINDPDLDIIINVTGDQSLHYRLLHEKKTQTELIGGASAELMWTLLDQYKKEEILGDRFNTILQEIKDHSSGDFIIGKTKSMQEIVMMIKQVAPTPTTILVQGETGTGKEIIAHMIHKNSPWSDKPLVTVNCTAISSTLIESELFGYKKGAFTGATADRTGLLELANKGTIFLDEIGDMPIEMQSKLLRFLQSGEIRPVGSAKSKLVKVRVIAATNRNLEQAIEEGDFRPDLFYRLNGFTLTLPPLRERKEDIPLLAYTFLRQAQTKVNKQVSSIASEALTALTLYSWPGNLRELENVMERSVILAKTSQITPDDLPLKFQPENLNGNIDIFKLEDGLLNMKEKKINQIEYEAICQYLADNNGNITHAAKSAKVSRRTYHRLMEKHGITLNMFKTGAILPARV